MTMQRTCYFCGKPVNLRRRMSLFCSERCEHVHRSLSSGSTGSTAARPPRPPAPQPPAPHDALPPPRTPSGRLRGLFRA